MTLKELSQCYDLKNEIEQLELKIKKLEDEATDTSAKITGMPHSADIRDKIGETVANLDAYKTKLIDRHKRYSIELIRLNDYISACPDSLTRQILTYRFVNGLSWNQVAASVGSSITCEAAKKIAYRYIRNN